ncbi:SDR family oxidoreductase [Terricaulis silvestris]|uniref:D-xylose 1-dehydrogenase n=1 Tax=Terricaulis silvestris TaxID=2686094 RepID=A0A6I6MQT8_9CAUL|nr:SDR family oxidoreductase [Terricaulis silvestris]QGZ93553.1 Rhamnolipids biosynthesis 3-oxoacyl-[acyl-carrier-protein] reductase [Terricaulis silvestris]
MSALQSLFGLDGKVALVTGGGRGIGRMITEGFIAAGAARVYIASRDADALARAADEIASDGRCIALPANLGTDAGCVALAEEISMREGKLDILVNNSGASWLAPFETYPEAAWDKVFQLNLKAPFFLARALAPSLEKAASGSETARIINIGSVAGEIAESMSTYAYGLSKGALHHLTRMLAKEFAARGIAVNAIAPGRFPSKMTKSVLEDRARYEAELASIPLCRWGTSDDMAGASLFLASRAAGYATGVILYLDGGVTLTSG